MSDFAMGDRIASFKADPASVLSKLTSDQLKIITGASLEKGNLVLNANGALPGGRKLFETLHELGINPRLRPSDGKIIIKAGTTEAELFQSTQSIIAKAQIVEVGHGKVVTNLTGDLHKPVSPLPEGALRQGAHGIFPEQMDAAATALSKRLGPEKAGSALNTMRDITAGKAISDTARREATTAFEDAGLLTAKGELTSLGMVMLKQDGAKFLAGAGIITAEGAKTASQAFAALARTPAEAAEALRLAGRTEELAAGEKVAAETATRVVGETAEAASLGSKIGGTILKKVPVAGQVLAVGTAVMGIAGAAHAETLPPEPQGAPQTQAEKHARELLEMQADGQKTMNVSKEVIKGALGLVPIPGADVAFDKYANSEQEKMQARADAASGSRRTLEGDGPQPGQPPAAKAAAPNRYAALTQAQNRVAADQTQKQQPRTRPPRLPGPGM
jgi:hypothetical protein